ncbi:MAG: glycosyltransferase family 9 protein [Candidatus Omnitrophota bacterium]
MNREIKKILCIKLWGLGNLIVLTPLMAKIKARYPQAKITFLTFDANRGFLERNQNIERIVYFQLTTDLLKIIRQTLSLIKDLNRERFDVGINFEMYNSTSIVFAHFLRIPFCVGFSFDLNDSFYAYSIKPDAGNHISSMFSALLKPLGIEADYAYEPLSPALNEVEHVCDVLRELKGDYLVGIHPGTSSNFKGKQYLRDRWVFLARDLILRHGANVVLTGTSADRMAVEWIRKAIGRNDKVINAAGIFNIGELAALMKKCRVYISNDTGPAHLAASLGVNLSVLYGPASPDRYGPLNANSLVFYKRDSCSPCVGVRYLNRKCRYHYRCLDFDPREIADKISERFFDAQVG